MEEVDTIIIGGGSAGCTLAGRLSASQARSVLLIEAGIDTPPGSEPASIRDSYPRSHGDPAFFWPDLHAEAGVHRADRQPPVASPYMQARVMGGGSSVMGMVGVRGLPADYDEWRDLGAVGWGWNDVLPFFRQLEHDYDFAGPMHGQTGPIPIRRNLRETWAPFARAVSEVWESRGYRFVSDNNADFGDGFAPVPMSNFPDRRVSSAMAYLTSDVRRRSNLKILTQAYATRLTSDGPRVTGVEVACEGSLRQIRAREVIVSAGSIHSPALLLRSGIGPAADIRRHGLNVIADLPAVGRNLQNHAVSYVVSHLPWGSAQPKHIHTWGQTSLRYSSGHAGCPGGDMALTVVNKSAWHPLGRRIGTIGIAINKAFSRGEVTLQNADARREPQVRFRVLSDERDFVRMVDALGFCYGILIDPRVSRVRNEVFTPNPMMVARLNQPIWSSWLKSLAISVAFDLAPALRRMAFTTRRTALDPARIAADRGALREMASTRTSVTYHGVGTCRMGGADDPNAVVDPSCRVRKVTGLRVVDGSVMPTIVSGNTNLPIIMIAEKVSAQILSEYTSV